MLKQIREAFEALSPEYWRDLAKAALSEEGADANKVAADLADAIDAALNFAILLPAPFGAFVEAFDDKIAERILAEVLEDLESPEEREAFVAKLRDGREGRKASRQEKRRAKRKAHKVSDMTPGHTE
jgi:siroheme synthase (precorrin-2 oxidase/ferrochelatase)